MRRISLWLFSTVAALVLLFSYRTSTGDAAPATPVAAAAPAVPTTEAPNGASKTYTGSVAQTQWGPVQVAITVANGKITDVQVPVYPNGNHRDEEINARALPVLTQETLAAQGSGIDTVSGATVTTNGYLESLQAALDAAHLT
ncbi:FMN-binding protein [Winogradskya humida]|uniref:FMN-binding protein n=1 Tax=Winogradskya humida TaxID=113566 RepID=A0ABQ3ZFL9_9ACTN|nr:FMN-binding protein [Actinoplanes humidus]GIE17360.1 FMN-binding protein [Actinoplanes humidus]